MSALRVFYAVHNHYWEDANLLAGLKQAGHDVVRYDPGHAFAEALSDGWTESDRARVSDLLVKAVKAAHADKPLDLFFSYLLKQLVYPEAIREIGSLGIPTVNYWCNGAHQFYLVDEISPAFDYCVATEESALPAYRTVGARPIYLQMAANPDIYRPYAIEREFDVTFVGQRYADRPEYIAYLLRNGVSARVWGPGWTQDRTFGEKLAKRTIPLSYVLRHPRSGAYQIQYYARKWAARKIDVMPRDEARIARAAGPSLPLEELVRMYSRSRISLGFSTCGDSRYKDRNKVRQVHLRDFEATMSGACFFVEYQKELEQFYEIGKEIVCYGSREELLERVRHFLSHPEESERVREAGHKRAMRDHTWARRFGELAQAIGLGVKPRPQRAAAHR